MTHRSRITDTVVIAILALSRESGAESGWSALADRGAAGSRPCAETTTRRAA